MRKIRLHFKDGRVITEPLERLARGNGLTGAKEGRALVDRWEKAGDIRRRPDGGFDVIRNRPRPDTVRAQEVLSLMRCSE